MPPAATFKSGHGPQVKKNFAIGGLCWVDTDPGGVELRVVTPAAERRLAEASRGLKLKEMKKGTQ
jgi:hypothetical protein